MAMVLPMAGVQHNFCTMSMVFIDCMDECPVELDDCCGEKGAHQPAKPDCMVSVKLLPSAEKSSPIQIPTLAGWSFLLPPIAVPASSRIIEPVSLEADQSPPNSPRLYLVQGCLLI